MSLYLRSGSLEVEPEAGILCFRKRGREVLPMGNQSRNWAVELVPLAQRTGLLHYYGSLIGCGLVVTPKAWHLLFPKGKDSLRGRHLHLVTDSRERDLRRVPAVPTNKSEPHTSPY